jgi:hypothetical protein
MGIEALNSAAWAAGFAMATAEDAFDDGCPNPAQTLNAQSVNAQWRPGEATLVHERPGDWFKAILSLFGRRRVSPA